jgi:hypothetical protein
MKIISSFHDYYDSVARAGIDSTIIYFRTTEELDVLPKDKAVVALEASKKIHEGLPAYTRSVCSRQINQFTTYAYYPIYILFCGKIRVTFAAMDNRFAYRPGKRIEEYVIPERMLTIATSYDEVNPRRLRYTHSAKERFKFFMEADGKPVNMVPLQAPVMVMELARYIINPCLKDYQFHKIVDPYTAFQELQMYISGVLSTGDKNPQKPISDELKAQSKGFDEWSFRKKVHQSKPRGGK